jgi:TolB-like protein/DNA-binding winged helix-turn-helix (wHTH) protein/Tfp pilus assembly protein PilF
MTAPSPTPPTFRFGPFEFDPLTGELRKDGAAVKLQKQPSDLLAVLLERPGGLVTREELRERLWPGKAFGDFDIGLNKAVRKLREALEDSAQTPRYVETLPQHGYRLIAPVEPVSPARQRRRAVPLYAVVAAGGLAVLLVGSAIGGFPWRTTNPAPIKSIAVLPFANLSGDPGQEYFADGVTDSLITELGKTSALRVISRQSTLRYKKGDKPLPEISRELDVDAVVEGSVVRTGERVRITAQLLRARPEQHLWAESYERGYTDILLVQAEIARSVAVYVKAKLTPGEQTRLGRARAVNPEAYEAYLRGRYLFHGYSPPSLRKAIESLETAVRIDPGFAQAWAALSPAYGALAYWGHVRPSEMAPKAEAAARKAIELDDTVADGHCWLGAARAYRSRDWPAAETELRRAIELNPNSSDAHETYSMVLISLRRVPKALDQIQIARGLDPFPPVRSTMVALCFHVSGQFQKAADQHRREIEIAPDFYITRWAYWRVLHTMGKSAEALAECKRSYELLNDAEVLQALEQGERQSGYAGAMKSAARVLERRTRTTYVSGINVARLYAFAGENARAVEWLETALTDGDPRLHLLWAEPDWAPLYGNPRFQNLLRRAGFPSVEKAQEWSKEAASAAGR